MALYTSRIEGGGGIYTLTARGVISLILMGRHPDTQNVKGLQTTLFKNRPTA